MTLSNLLKYAVKRELGAVNFELKTFKYGFLINTSQELKSKFEVLELREEELRTQLRLLEA
ncbi:MAG TPA: hypothetical protein VF691_05580 [Cytophagaceae bacterium]|jgi:hypothetical protein